MRPLLAVLLLVAGLAGCLSDAPTDSDPAPPMDEPATADPHVVVAVLDTAVNPYHVHYQRNASLPQVLLDRFVDAETGNLPVRVQLTTNGTLEERREADSAFWDNITEGQLYYFEGTRLLAVAHGGNIIDGGSHGTATTSSVFDANPNAIVVLSQGFGGASETWSAKQPWIDITSHSYGPIGSPPTFLVSDSSTAENNRITWNRGGLAIGASDNTPALAPLDTTAGPPWVVGVAGSHPDGEADCREPVSGNLPDFVADFTQELPLANTIDEYGSTSGTSFSTPMTAGSFSRALLQVREAWGHTEGIVDGALALGPDGERLTNVDLRDAFNRTAVYFDLATSCDEGGSVPVNPAAPWVQMGWGHVDMFVGDAAANHLLGIDAAADKPAAAVAHQEALYAEREATWGSA